MPKAFDFVFVKVCKDFSRVDCEIVHSQLYIQSGYARILIRDLVETSSTNYSGDEQPNRYPCLSDPRSASTNPCRFLNAAFPQVLCGIARGESLGHGASTRYLSQSDTF